ncbi:hypothetical protein ACFLRM_03660 [Acidobacteriota bacterium]
MRFEFKEPDDVDLYLKQKYNFGVLDFTESICFIYEAYKIKNIKNLTNLSKERIKDLKKAEEIIIRHLDNFDIKPTLIAIDSCIERTKNYIEFAKGLYSFLETNHKIKPTNLLILVWAFALKKNEQIKWSEIENLYCWFSNKFEWTDFERFFKAEADFPLRQTLKKKIKKYLNKKEYFKYYKLGKFIFDSCFRGNRRGGELPDPFDIEIELLKYSSFGVKIRNAE